MEESDYLTAERYERQLEVFTNAGWDVWFDTNKEKQTCHFCGRHAQFQTKFRIALDVADFKNEKLVPAIISEYWVKVNGWVETQWAFPKMRLHTLDWTHEPVNWQELGELLQMESSSPDDLQDELRTESFRRWHGIVLASPFRDRNGELLYELDMIELRRKPLVLLTDDTTKHWFTFSKGDKYQHGSVVTGGRKIGRTGVDSDGQPSMILL